MATHDVPAVAAILHKGLALERWERSTCRYLVQAGITKDTLERLFCASRRAIDGAVNNKTNRGNLKDTDDDIWHMRAEYRALPGETVRDFERRIEILAAEAQRKLRQEILAGSAPPNASRLPAQSWPRSHAEGPQHRLPDKSHGASSSKAGASDGVPMFIPSPASTLTDLDEESDDSDVVALPGRPPRKAAVRACLLMRQQALELAEDELAPSGPSGPPARVPDSDDETEDEIEVRPPPSQTRSLTKKRRMSASDSPSPTKTPAKVARISTNDAAPSAKARSPPQISNMPEPSPYVSPPLTPIIDGKNPFRRRPKPSVPTEPPEANAAFVAEQPCEEDDVALLDENALQLNPSPPAELPIPPQVMQHASSRDDTTNDKLLDWLRSIRLDHKIDLLRQVGFNSLDDAKDAAVFAHAILVDMMASLEKEGMTKFETWRLRDGLEKLKTGVPHME